MKQNFIFMGAVTLLLGTAVATKAQIVIPAPTYQYTFDGGDAFTVCHRVGWFDRD